MRYLILMTLAVCAFGQTAASPPVVQQYRAFQPPDWLKRQYHIYPSKPVAPGTIQPFAAPNSGAPGFGVKGLASRAITAQKMRDCAVPMNRHWHAAPGLVFSDAGDPATGMGAFAGRSSSADESLRRR